MNFFWVVALITSWTQHRPTTSCYIALSQSSIPPPSCRRLNQWGTFPPLANQCLLHLLSSLMRNTAYIREKDSWKICFDFYSIFNFIWSSWFIFVKGILAMSHTFWWLIRHLGFFDIYSTLESMKISSDIFINTILIPCRRPSLLNLRQSRSGSLKEVFTVRWDVFISCFFNFLTLF